MSEVERTAPVEYRPIEGFPGYRVGNDGSVWSEKKRSRAGWVLGGTWRPLKATVQSLGYASVMLYCGDRHPLVKVHHLVLCAFVGPRPRGMECCHNNGVRTDNRLENLRWDTRLANMDDRRAHGNQMTGETHANAKLNDEAVRAIRRVYGRDRSNGADLAHKYGVTRQAIWLIATRRSWRHVV